MQQILRIGENLCYSQLKKLHKKLVRITYPKVRRQNCCF